MRTAISFPVHTAKSFKLGSQLGLIALFAGLAAGCSGGMPFREPVFTGSTPNQQQIITGQASAGQSLGGVQTASVQANDLPPPAGAQTAGYAAAPPAPYTPPAPYAAPGMPTPLGQVASGAPSSLGAPPTTLNQQAATIGGPAAAAGAGSHVVQPGDTMWNISQRYNIPVEQLMAANGGGTNIRIGQTLAVPGAGGSTQQPAPAQLASLDPQAITAPAPAAAAVAPVPPAQVAAASEIIPPAPAGQQVALATPEGDPAAAPAPAQQPAAAGSTSFRWPVRGRVIAGFGRRPDGERNDGINLSVPEGTEVRAAEDGTVIYAGNELKSYGNLVLIRHDDGWVSAYAHNSQLQVNRGDTVQRGQVVALSGMTGGVTTPQVHFELRHDATPVDPLQHLSEG